MVENIKTFQLKDIAQNYKNSYLGQNRVSPLQSQRTGLLFMNEGIQERVTDVGNESGMAISPFSLVNVPLQSLDEALLPLDKLVRDLASFGFIALQFVDKLDMIPYNLTRDEAAAINLYTRDWINPDDSLYHKLNSALRNVDRKQIVPYLPYLKLLLTALSKIPSFKSSKMSLWRGVEDDENGTISKSYLKNKKYFWWGFSSCTTNMEVLDNFLKNDSDKKRVIFKIQCNSHAVDLRNFSLFGQESEVLLLPARYLEVKNIFDITSQTVLIELQEIISPAMINGLETSLLITSQRKREKLFDPYKNIDGEKTLPKELNESFDSYKTSADQGNQEAQYCLAKLYKNGQGVPKDLNEAFRLFKLSADQGNAKAQFNLALMYYKGKGVAVDWNEAVKLYKLSSDQGYPKAQYNLALMYYNGKGVSKNLHEAIGLYKLSAEKGNSSAQNNLGLMYENGEGVPRDLAEAVRYYKLAADQGNFSSQYNLALMYKHGEGVPRDFQESIRLFKLAAEQGNQKAQFNLGRLYEFGQGTSKDLFEAFKLYKLSSDQGYPKAQLHLALMYKKGKGVSKDLNEAMRLFKLSADQGNSIAQINLNKMLRSGKTDLKEVVRFFKYAGYNRLK